MIEPRIVTAKEAAEALAYWREHGRSGGAWAREEDAAYTIATEPARIRALMEKAEPNLYAAWSQEKTRAEMAEAKTEALEDALEEALARAQFAEGSTHE